MRCLPLLVFVACRAPRVPSPPEMAGSGCGPDAPRSCLALAGRIGETHPQAAISLLSWACREGEAAACREASERAPQSEMVVDWTLAGCAEGDSASCLEAWERGYEHSRIAPGMRRACLSGAASSCEVATEQGWVQPGITRLDVLPLVRHGVPFFTQSGAVVGLHEGLWGFAWEGLERVDGMSWLELDAPFEADLLLHPDARKPRTVREVLGHAIVDGRRLVLTEARGLALWWPDTGEVRWLAGDCGVAALSGDGRVVVVPQRDAQGGCRQLHRVRTVDLEAVGNLEVPRNVRLLSLDHDGDRLAVGLDGGTTLVVNWAGTPSIEASIAPPEGDDPRSVRQAVEVGRPSSDDALELSWSPTGDRLVSTWRWSELRTWNDGDAWELLGSHAAAVAWSGAGDLFALGERLEGFAADNTPLMQPITVSTRWPFHGSALTVSPDGRRLALMAGRALWLVELSGAEPLPELSEADHHQVTNHNPQLRSPRSRPGPTFGLLGVLMLPEGHSVAGVRMTATWKHPAPPPAKPVRHTVTDAEGHFFFPLIDEGAWEIAPDIQGFGPCAHHDTIYELTYRIACESRPDTDTGEENRGADGASGRDWLWGTVSVVDEQGRTFRSAHAVNDVETHRCSVMANQVRCDHLPPGDTVVWATLRDGTRLTNPASVSLQEHSTVDAVQAIPDRLVEGRVAERGMGVAGALVSCDCDHAWTLRTLSSWDGSFSFSIPPTCDPTFNVVADGYHGVSRAWEGGWMDLELSPAGTPSSSSAP